jgi:hypothetical protein
MKAFLVLAATMIAFKANAFSILIAPYVYTYKPAEASRCQEIAEALSANLILDESQSLRIGPVENLSAGRIVGYLFSMDTIEFPFGYDGRCEINLKKIPDTLKNVQMLCTRRMRSGSPVIQIFVLPRDPSDLARVSQRAKREIL